MRDANEPERVQVPDVTAVQVHTFSGTDPQEIAAAFEAAMTRMSDFVHEQGLALEGAPRGIYTAYGPEGTEFTIAMPVASGAEGGSADGLVEVGEITGGEALRWTHKGPYRELARTYDRITEWMKAHDMLDSERSWEKHGPMWEEYVSDPGNTPEDELVTQIYVPLA